MSTGLSSKLESLARFSDANSSYGVRSINEGRTLQIVGNVNAETDTGSPLDLNN